MAKIPLAQLASLNHDTIVQATEGTIFKVGKLISGTGQHGPFTFQDVTLKDGATEFKCVFGNRPDQTGNIGDRVGLVAANGTRGLTGLKMEEREVYKKPGEFEKILRVSASAVITPISQAARGGSAPTGQQSPQRAASGPQQATGRDTGDAPIPRARKFLGRNASIVKAALRQAMVIRAEYNEYNTAEGTPGVLAHKDADGQPMSDAMFVTVYNSVIFGAGTAGVIALLPTRLDFATLTDPAAAVAAAVDKKPAPAPKPVPPPEEQEQADPESDDVPF